MLKRYKISELVKWRDSPARAPLLVNGARQVGKTTLIKAFGQAYFPAMHYFNFEADSWLKAIFAQDFKIDRILNELATIGRQAIAERDLIFFDEIQECPRALTALKYFNETKPEQAIIAAGSLLGVALSGASYPVGKVSHFWLGPCTFEEFVEACGDDIALTELKQFKLSMKISSVGHDLLWGYLKLFYVCGGLPRPMSVMVGNRDNLAVAFSKVREVQQELLRDYRSDFSKHSEKENAVHIRAVFESISEQLCRVQDLSTNKFKFTNVIPNRKGYSALQNPIAWLTSAGLATRVPIINKPELPFSSYTKESHFKLYPFDIGVLAAQANLPPETIFAQDYGTAKGYFAETLALQALRTDDITSIPCLMEGQSEIEFMIVRGGAAVPIEVKSGTRTQAKSLGAYIKRYRPKLAIKLSNQMPGYNTEQKLWTLPLYAAWSLQQLNLV